MSSASSSTAAAAASAAAPSSLPRAPAAQSRGSRDRAPDALSPPSPSATERAKLRVASPFLQALLDRRPADATHAPPYLQFLSPMVRYSKLPFRLLCRRFGADLAFTPMIIAKDVNRGSFATDLPPSVSAEYAAACARAAEARALAEAAAGQCGVEGLGGRGTRVGSGTAVNDDDDSSGADGSASVVRMPILTPSPSPSDPYSSRVTVEEFSTAPADRPLIAQLAANDPVELSRCAAAFAALVDGVDINCGCPQSWIIKEKCGAALSAQPQLVAELVRAARSTLPAGMTVSVKVRLRPDLRETVELVRRAAAAGADWVTVHGRTRDEGTTPAVRADAIALVRSAAGVPVIFNGDVTTPAGADAAVAATGAAGVLLARGALANPAVFAGYASPPAAVVADYTSIAARYGGPWAGHLHHARYALYTPCGRARRAALARGKSLAGLVDAGAVAAAGGAGVDAGVPGGWGGRWGQWGQMGQWGQCGNGDGNGDNVLDEAVCVPGEFGLWGGKHLRGLAPLPLPLPLAWPLLSLPLLCPSTLPPLPLQLPLPLLRPTTAGGAPWSAGTRPSTRPARRACARGGRWPAWAGAGC